MRTTTSRSYTGNAASSPKPADTFCSGCRAVTSTRSRMVCAAIHSCEHVRMQALIWSMLRQGIGSGTSLNAR